MTNDEKARAYDEALKKIQSLYEQAKRDDNPIWSTYEHLFPQLRESEEENLKNKSGYYKAGKFWKASTLWNAVKGKSPQRVPNRYILQECTWNISSLQHFADEVKNVQEVDLNYPIILDINGNILDGAHRVVRAYLEGKDIDIVYLGDDEWPEPDYDEEKAIKESEDERINKALIDCLNQYKTLLADKGISTEQVISYLEKQKEQKHVEYLDKNKVYAIMTKLTNLSYSQLIPINSDEYKKLHEITSEVRDLLDYPIEQKPAEINEYEIIKKHITEDVLSSEVNKRLKECGWYVTDEKPAGATINGEPIPTDNQSVDIPLAEWSEDDGEKLDSVLGTLHCVGNFNFDSWIRSLPERFNLQPKNEWSEEDEEIFNNIIEKAKGGHWIEVNEITWLINRFKSLRPSWKPSEEQPEVDIKKELHAYICSDEYMNTREDGSLLIAKHFYSLGLNARKI